MKKQVNWTHARAALLVVVVALTSSSAFAGRLTKEELKARYDASYKLHMQTVKEYVKLTWRQCSTAKKHEGVQYWADKNNLICCARHRRVNPFARDLREYYDSYGLDNGVDTFVAWTNPWNDFCSQTGKQRKAFRLTKQKGKKQVRMLTPIIGSEPEPFLFDSPQVFNGYLATIGEKEADFKGTIQVKVERADVNPETGAAVSKAVATIQVVGQKALTLEGRMEMDIEGRWGSVIFMSKKGQSLVIDVGYDWMSGEFYSKGWGASNWSEDYVITGARDLFESYLVNDHMRLATYLKKWEKPMVLAWKSDPYANKMTREKSRFAGWNAYTILVGAKGHVKVCGTSVDGTKVQTTSQLIVASDGTCYIPVVINEKNTEHAFNVILPEKGMAHVWGPQNVQVSGVQKALASTSFFKMEDGYPLWCQLEGGFAYTEYLPNEMEIVTNGSNWWLFPEAGKVVLNKYGLVNRKKLGSNPSGLNLEYQMSDGTFKGSFKAYVNRNGWPKPITVQVNGVMLNGIGYGTASVKDIGSVPIMVA